MEELRDFIQGDPDKRELKRALAVQMVMENYTHSQIAEILHVSVGFVNKWKYIFVEQGIAGLKLKYQGSKGYLNSNQKQAVMDMLKNLLESFIICVNHSPSLSVYLNLLFTIKSSIFPKYLCMIDFHN
jgi:predicted transcriptional regulator